MSDLPYVIEIKVAAHSREALVGAFEAECKRLQRSGYTEQNGGTSRGSFSGGFGGSSCTVAVKEPPEKPLTSDELRRLRGLLK